MSPVDPLVVPDWFRAKFLAENPNDEHRVEEAWRSGNAGIVSACPAPRSLRELHTAFNIGIHRAGLSVRLPACAGDDCAICYELRAALPGDDAQEARDRVVLGRLLSELRSLQAAGSKSYDEMIDVLARRLVAQDATPAPQGWQLLIASMLNYLYKSKDASAEACNLWEQAHAASGNCAECAAKWPDYASLPAPPVSEDTP